MFYRDFQIYPFTPSTGCDMVNASIPRRTVVKTSAKGRPYLDWAPMPRIPDEYLECVVYLYPSIPAAEKGEKAGGTGFVVGIRGEVDKDLHFLYVVTNRHVIKDGNTTVRINTNDGRHDSIEYDERNWILGPKGIDLAIYPIPELDENKFKLRVVEPSDFLTETEIINLNIGIGDEVFFMGRFASVEGRERNVPTLRFGTIAQIPRETVDGEISFLIEARSIPGFSGSPVFVYIPGSEDNRVKRAGDRRAMDHVAFGPKLLGIDWGHILELSDAYDERGTKLSFKVRSNSGLMTVVPYWFLDQILFHKEVVRMRQERETEILSKRVSSRDSLKIEKPSLPSTDENPTHREDFMRLVGAAARKPPQEG